MAATLGIIANTRKELLARALPPIIDWFSRKQVDAIFADDIPRQLGQDVAPFPVLPKEDLPGACDVIMAFGGDGTILYTVQLVGARQTPILGVNVGGLGFLTDIPLETCLDKFQEIIDGKFFIEERLILRGDIEGQDKPMYALNEMMIEKSSSVRVIQIETHINDAYLNVYVADGLLISTPTGSTGYSLSSGGPIVAPNNDVLIINPICPHSLTNRPLIVSADSIIRAQTRTEHPTFIIAADGQDVRHCPTRTTIRVGRAGFKARLVKPQDGNFYEILRSKLGWAKDLRDKSRWSHDS